MEMGKIPYNDTHKECLGRERRTSRKRRRRNLSLSFFLFDIPPPVSAVNWMDLLSISHCPPWLCVFLYIPQCLHAIHNQTRSIDTLSIPSLQSIGIYSSLLHDILSSILSLEVVYIYIQRHEPRLTLYHGGKKRRVCVFIIKRHAAAAASFSLYTHSIQPDDDDNRFFFSFK